MASATFISCDWGSTSFRLRVVERITLRVMAEQRAAEGIKVYAALAPAERAAAMEAFLRRRLAAWPEIETTAPIVMSGMASSTVGWTEVPYARIPFPLDGSGCRLARLNLTVPGGGKRAVIVVSGLRTDHDIMRGEECALVGALTLRPDCLSSETEVLALLAGTHCKHARIAGGAVQSFVTHLTGELFEALSHHSLLATSLNLKAGGETPDLPAFRAGVACARERGASAALFQVRARDVLQGCCKVSNAWFLSGVLVGSELSHLRSEDTRGRVLLLGAPLRTQLYREALRELDLVDREAEVPAVDLDTAVVAGHAVILRRVENDSVT